MVNLSDWTVYSVPERWFILRRRDDRVVEGFVRLLNVPIDLSWIMTWGNTIRVILINWYIHGQWFGRETSSFIWGSLRITTILKRYSALLKLNRETHRFLRQVYFCSYINGTKIKTYFLFSVLRRKKWMPETLNIFL